MAKRHIDLNPDIAQRIDFLLVNVFGTSSQALANYLLDRALRVFEEQFPKLEEAIKSNPELIAAFNEVIKTHNKKK